VKPDYAAKIFDGTKTVELRRRRPRVEQGDYLIIYVPAPVKQLAGVVVVEEVIQDRVHTLWRRVRSTCGITHSDFMTYFAGVEVGYGIRLGRPGRLASPVPLDALRRINPGFNPQGYRYLSRDRISEALGKLRHSPQASSRVRRSGRKHKLHNLTT
jgi:predicted transcriptional regulator